MPRSHSTKSEEDQASSRWVPLTLGQYVMIVLNRTFDPVREQCWRSDVEFARYMIRNMAAVLASHGPQSLDERSPMDSTPVESADQIPAFERNPLCTAEWKNALVYVSQLSSLGVTLLCSTDGGDPTFSDVLAIVDLLSCVQRRIVEVLEPGFPI